MYRKVIYNGQEISVPKAHAQRLVAANKATWPNNESWIDVAEDLENIEQEISKITGKPKRQYRRRDMRAED